MHSRITANWSERWTRFILASQLSPEWARWRWAGCRWRAFSSRMHHFGPLIHQIKLCAQNSHQLFNTYSEPAIWRSLTQRHKPTSPSIVQCRSWSIQLVGLYHQTIPPSSSGTSSCTPTPEPCQLYFLLGGLLHQSRHHRSRLRIGSWM